jgi:hypothetical protein
MSRLRNADAPRLPNPAKAPTGIRADAVSPTFHSQRRASDGRQAIVATGEINSTVVGPVHRTLSTLSIPPNRPKAWNEPDRRIH